MPLFFLPQVQPQSALVLLQIVAEQVPLKCFKIIWECAKIVDFRDPEKIYRKKCAF